MGVAKTAGVVVVSSVLAAVAAIVLGGFTEVEHRPDSIRAGDVAPPLSAAEVSGGAGYFRTNSGLWLYTHRFAARTTGGDGDGDAAKGTVLLMHGFGEHVLRNGYAKLVAALTGAGWDVHTHEHQGHGRSDGERGYNPVFARYVDDALQYHGTVVAAHRARAGAGAGAGARARTPVVLLAHSMGSLVALSALRRASAAGLYDAVLLSGTCTFVDPDVATPALLAVGRVISDWAPKLPLATMDLDTLTGNATARAVYERDEWVYHGGLKARWAAGFVDTAAALSAALDQLPPLPLLAVHGARDRICLPQGARDVTSRSASAKAGVATLKLYDNGYHELFDDEPTTGAALRDMLQWLEGIAKSGAKAKADTKASA